MVFDLKNKTAIRPQKARLWSYRLFCALQDFRFKKIGTAIRPQKASLWSYKKQDRDTTKIPLSDLASLLRFKGCELVRRDRLRTFCILESLQYSRMGPARRRDEL